MKAVFTLCSNNYLAQAKVLGDSVLKFNPDYTFIIGLVDAFHSEVDYSFLNPFKLLPVTEIGIDEIDELIKKYNIVEFNTAVKPFYFEFLFQEFSPTQVIYLDPDTVAFSKFSEIDMLLTQYDFLLTPHLLTIRVTEEPAMETLILNVGIFNLGFLALTNSHNSFQMIMWWKVRMRKYCYINFCQGLFVDQIWANFIPSYFTNYHILRSSGYNVGYWNFDERAISVNDSGYMVNEKDHLIFFHFSNFNPLHPDKLCKWLDYSFEKRPDLSQLYENYSHELLDCKYEKFSKLKPLLSFKEATREVATNRSLSVSQKLGEKILAFNSRVIKKIFSL
jgi:hypothetical protein